MIPLPPDLRRRPLWIHRPLLNWQDVYRWAIESGAVEIIHHKHLHTTLATARGKVDWYLLGGTHDDIVEVPAGEKPMIALGDAAHALSFEHHALEQRFREIASRMSVDYADDWCGHVTLGRGDGFRQPAFPYTGKLVFGPEIVEPFFAGISFPRAIPINRNQYRGHIGLLPHDDELAKRDEHLTRTRKPFTKKVREPFAR